MNRIFILIAVVGMASLAGCEKKQLTKHEQSLEREFYQPFLQASAVPAKETVLPEYRLNVGDMLEIIYHVKHVPVDDYRLSTEDTINIRFAYHPMYDQTVVIPPSGRVQLLLIGKISTLSEKPDDRVLEYQGVTIERGKTVEEFQAEVQGEYAEFLKDPELAVTVQTANKKIEELKRAITTAPRGQSRLMPVKPDGYITLPFITDVRAYGQTIEELHKELNTAYADVGLPELEVTVQILSVAPRKIYVMGEVRGPGVQSVDNMVTLSQALAMAGGITPRGDTHKVLVVRRKGLPMPQGTVVDMEEILENSTVEVGDDKDRQKQLDTKKWMKDFWLDDYDVVYVPRTDLARGNDWIDQVFTKGIWAIMPFSTSLGMNFGYQVYNAPSSYGTNDTTRWSNMANSVWND